ncbi:tRNA-specific adenosine deaminase 2-like [Oscarella lobularis]|uniref:tRNA-specific adenosine deaminase 2-like n=1 Tax=Oscarella lobularis TaxID=121494 RepID=UPI0033136E3B
MERALAVARESQERSEVPVGCIIEFEGKEIAQGSNEVNVTKNATRHAELVALDALYRWCDRNSIQRQTVLEKSVLFVTVEPCIMCSAALRTVGLRRIVYGCANERFGGCGSVMDVHTTPYVTKSRASLPPLECRGGEMAERAVSLLKAFYDSENPHAPEPKRKKKA